MARTLEEILKDHLGRAALQAIQMQAEIEALTERLRAATGPTPAPATEPADGQ